MGREGVGAIAIQVAKAIGVRVVTTARSADHAFTRSLGADETVDFTSEDYVEAIARHTDREGADVVFDTLGADALTRSPGVFSAFERVVRIVHIAQPQNLIEAWVRNARLSFRLHAAGAAASWTR